MNKYLKISEIKEGKSYLIRLKTSKIRQVVTARKIYDGSLVFKNGDRTIAPNSVNIIEEI